MQMQNGNSKNADGEKERGQMNRSHLPKFVFLQSVFLPSLNLSFRVILPENLFPPIGQFFPMDQLETLKSLFAVLSIRILDPFSCEFIQFSIFSFRRWSLLLLPKNFWDSSNSLLQFLSWQYGCGRNAQRGERWI